MTSSVEFPDLDNRIMPGIYKNIALLTIDNRDLIFDAENDENALFYIIADSIEFINASSITLENGAQYQNIYWRSANQISFDQNFVGTIFGIFLAGTTFSTEFTNDIYGNLYSNSGTITLMSVVESTESLYMVTENPTNPPPPPPPPEPVSSNTWILPTILGVLFLLFILSSRRVKTRRSSFF